MNIEHPPRRAQARRVERPTPAATGASTAGRILNEKKKTEAGRQNQQL